MTLSEVQQLCLAGPEALTLHYVPISKVVDGKEETDFRLEVTFPTAAGLGKVCWSGPLGSQQSSLASWT